MNRGKEASDNTNETRMALTVESSDADDLTFLQLKAKWFATDSDGYWSFHNLSDI